MREDSAVAGGRQTFSAAPPPAAPAVGRWTSPLSWLSRFVRLSWLSRLSRCPAAVRLATKAAMATSSAARIPSPPLALPLVACPSLEGDVTAQGPSYAVSYHAGVVLKVAALQTAPIQAESVHGFTYVGALSVLSFIYVAALATRSSSQCISSTALLIYLNCP